MCLGIFWEIQAVLWGVPHLSGARCSMLGRGLVACWGTRGLGLMNCTRVVGEGLWSYKEKEIISVKTMLYIVVLLSIYCETIGRQYRIY